MGYKTTDEEDCIRYLEAIILDHNYYSQEWLQPKVPELLGICSVEVLRIGFRSLYNGSPWVIMY